MNANRVIDYLIPVAFLAAGIGATTLLLGTALPDALVTVLVVGPLALAAALLERLRPELPGSSTGQVPLRNDALHFFTTYQLGTIPPAALLALLAARVRESGHAHWPEAWPLPAQLLFGLLCYEGVSYWQHRLGHTVPLFWRFHALHHSGAHLNLARTGRFHFMDIGAGTVAAMLPLALLGASGHLLTWSAVAASVCGILQHSNIRMRTPRWASMILCTPAVHRSHHSLDLVEGNRNFGTTTMVFDLLFGSWKEPAPGVPAAYGVQGDATPPGFLAQVFGPFRL